MSASDSRTRGKRVADKCRGGYKRARKGFVIFITSDKILQAILTGAVTSVVFSLNEGIAVYVQQLLTGSVPVFVPVKIYAAAGASVVVVLAYWLDRNTEAWREYVRFKTGEETAKDTASDEDVAGEEKEGDDGS